MLPSGVRRRRVDPIRGGAEHRPSLGDGAQPSPAAERSGVPGLRPLAARGAWRPAPSPDWKPPTTSGRCCRCARPRAYFPDFLTPGRATLPWRTAWTGCSRRPGADSSPNSPGCARTCVVRCRAVCGGWPPVKRPRFAGWAVPCGAITPLPWHRTPSLIRGAGHEEDRAGRAQAALGGGAEALLANYAELPGWRRQELPARGPLPRAPAAARFAGCPLTLLPGFLRTHPAGPGGRVAAARAGASAGSGAGLAPPFACRRGQTVRRPAGSVLPGPTSWRRWRSR